MRKRFETWQETHDYDHVVVDADLDLDLAFFKVWQAAQPQWVSVEGYKDVPVGDWLVYMPEARDKIQSAHIHKNVSTIGGNFAFDLPQVTAYCEQPPAPHKGI